MWVCLNFILNTIVFYLLNCLKTYFSIFMTVRFLIFLQSLSLLLLSPFSVQFFVFWTIFHDFFEKLRSTRWHQIDFYWHLWSLPDWFSRKLLRNHRNNRFSSWTQDILRIMKASKRFECCVFHRKAVKFQGLPCGIALLFANCALFRVFKDFSIFGLPTLVTYINSKYTYKQISKTMNQIYTQKIKVK